MSTRSSAKNLFPPLDNPDLTIQRRSRADPTFLNDFEMVAEGNGDPPVPDLRTMKHRDTINAAAGGTFMKRRSEECYDLIENMNAHHNDWDTSAQRSESSSSITSSSDSKIVALKVEMAKINKNLMKVLQINHQVKSITPSCETNQNRNQGNNHGIPQGNNQERNQFFQGASHGQNPPPAYQEPAYQAQGYQASVHQPLIPQRQVVTTTEFTNYMKANDAILKNMQTNMTSLTNFNLGLKNMFGQFMKMNTASSSGSRTLPSNTITNLKEDLKGITTRSGNAYQGPTIPTTSSSLPKVVERETKVTKDTVPPTDNRNTKDIQPSVIQNETLIPNSKPVVALVVELVAALVSAPKPNQKPSILYPSRLHDQKLCDKTNEQKEEFFKIFQDLIFNISFADALILMPKFGLTIKSLLNNKEKLFELARTLLNEHCSAVLLKKLPEKLGDPVVDFDADPRVPLILGRSYLMIGKALIDVYEGELTLRVGKEAITFNLNQTSRYSANYNNMTANRIDVIDMASKNDKSSIDEPLEVKLKDLPPHLEYAFLEGDDNLPVIIANDLSVEEKAALIKVLKSHKQAIAWKLFDIKGIDPRFCTHKILMEDDYKPAVQRQRRPVGEPNSLRPKKGGMTVVANENNELIPTRLVIGWRVCIDYRKLNNATRKDHFSLPFMDQMLERLA
nr:hypothetical protein [Tanacetum cinerariifolium]